jgi:hypothetical protein
MRRGSAHVYHVCPCQRQMKMTRDPRFARRDENEMDTNKSEREEEEL